MNLSGMAKAVFLPGMSATARAGHPFIHTKSARPAPSHFYHWSGYFPAFTASKAEVMALSGARVARLTITFTTRFTMNAGSSS